MARACRQVIVSDGDDLCTNAAAASVEHKRRSSGSSALKGVLQPRGQRSQAQPRRLSRLCELRQSLRLQPLACSLGRGAAGWQADGLLTWAIVIRRSANEMSLLRFADVAAAPQPNK